MVKKLAENKEAKLFIQTSLRAKAKQSKSLRKSRTAKRKIVSIG